MPHGSRRSYVAGCRCVVCRSANAAYRPVARVDAGPARLHLQQLRALGVGTRQIADQTGVGRGLIVRVLAGQAQLGAATAAQLLTARPVLAHGCAVPGTKTWRYVDSLKREGYTKRELAFHLGHHAQQLQLQPRHVRVRSALKVAQLYDRIAG